MTGVWVGREKLAALGVRLSPGWLPSPGFAFNVSGDLDGFATIVPCGIAARGVPSLGRLTDREWTVEKVADLVAARLAEVFEHDLRPAQGANATKANDERLATGEAQALC